MTTIVITHILIIITVFINDCFLSLHWNFLLSFDFFVTPGQKCYNKINWDRVFLVFSIFPSSEMWLPPTFTLGRTTGFTVEAGCCRSVSLFFLISTSELLSTTACTERGPFPRCDLLRWVLTLSEWWGCWNHILWCIHKAMKVEVDLFVLCRLICHAESLTNTQSIKLNPTVRHHIFAHSFSHFYVETILS